MLGPRSAPSGGKRVSVFDLREYPWVAPCGGSAPAGGKRVSVFDLREYPRVAPAWCFVCLCHVRATPTATPLGAVAPGVSACLCWGERRVSTCLVRGYPPVPVGHVPWRPMAAWQTFLWQTADSGQPSWVFLADVPKSNIKNSNSYYFKVCKRLPRKCGNVV